MEEQDKKQRLKELIEFLNSKKGKPLVKSAIKVLYGSGDGLNKIKIDKLDKFFNIEYKIIEAILNPSFKDELKNDNIIDRFSGAKSELENLKNNDKKMQNELSSLIIPPIDMGVILKNLATNCKVDSVEFENDQEENANFISICRIINRLIDNLNNMYDRYGMLKTNNTIENRIFVATDAIFRRTSHKVFWEYLAKIPNIKVYVNNLLNSEIKFKDEECQKLQNRFLEYQKGRGTVLKNRTCEEDLYFYDVEFSIDKDGALRPVEEVEILDDDKKPFSFWKIILLLAIVLAFGGSGFFGFNAWLVFIAFITNFWSIIITIAVLVLLSILLMVAHKTGAFKVGKLFCSGKYEDDSWFYLRQGKEHENESEISEDNSETEITDRELTG